MSHPSVPPVELPASHAEDRDGQRRRRLWFYALTITAAAALGLAGIVNARPLLSANDRSRWCTVWSLVERGTWRIDEIIQRPGWDTIDKVLHEGHFYSSKPPLLSYLTAGVYRAVKSVTGWDLLAETEPAARAVVAVVNLLPWIVALVVIALIAERYARTTEARAFVVVAAAFGTFLTTFLVTLNNHTVAAVSVVLALYPALRIVADGVRSPLAFAACGLFAAFASTNELPAALFGVALFGRLFWTCPRRTAAWFVPAALVPLAAFFWTTYDATGGWKPFYMYYGTEKYLYVHEGVPSYWLNPQGLDRSTDSPWTYFLHCTVGHHGIVSLSPLFLLTAAGWAGLLRTGRRGGRGAEGDSAGTEQDARAAALVPFQWMGLLLTIGVLGFYLTRTENYNYGGNTAGLRWMFWLIPFWLLGMIPVLDAWGDRRWFRAAAAGALFVSVFSALYPLQNPWQQPWLFVWMERQGWIDYRDPPPPKFERPLTTWFPSFPAAGAESRGAKGGPAWIEFAGPGDDGSLLRLRLTDGGRREVDGRVLRRLIADWNLGDPRARTEVLDFDERLFESGAPPARSLRWPEGEPSEEERREAIVFAQGLPRARPYNAGRIEYLKTPLRTDAFRCQKGESRVPHRLNDGSPVWFRTDLWLSDEVPFGVLQVVQTIQDARTGALLSRRTLTAVAAGGAEGD